MTNKFKIFSNIKKRLVERFGAVAGDKRTIPLLLKANRTMTIDELEDSAQTIASWTQWLYYVECRCRNRADIQTALSI